MNARFGCPECGGEQIKEASTVHATYPVESWDDDGTPNFGVAEVHWDTAESLEEDPWHCPDCLADFTEPVRIPEPADHARAIVENVAGLERQPSTTHTPTCRFCGLAVVDGREESGFTGEGPDWMTPDGDFGCSDNPGTDEDGTCGHAVTAEEEQEARVWAAERQPSTYTGGEWYTDGGMIFSSYDDPRGATIATVPEPANADRIVQCVNACAGINPEAVPELLAALEVISRDVGVRAWLLENDPMALRQADTAIARARGES